jgi:hypothetical protein
MPSLFLSTEHPLHPRGSTPQPILTMESLWRRNNLFKFAHLFRDVSGTFGSHDAKLSLMNRVRNLNTEALAMRVIGAKCFTLKTMA